MVKKLICIDIDGTLVDSKGNLPPLNKKAILEAQKQGHIICITTARPWRRTKDIYQELELNTLVSNYNGGLIQNPNDDCVEDIEHKIPSDKLELVLNNKSWKHKIHLFILENKKAVFISKIDKSAMKHYNVMDAEITSFSENYDEYIKHGAIGALLLVKHKYDPLKVRSELEKKFGDTLSFNYWVEASEGIVLDISNKNVSKGEALKLFAKNYNIDMKNTIAIGDSWNDISMFEVAGKSFAMANSTDETKNKAKIVSSKTNDQSAVAHILIEELNLNIKKTD